MSLLSAWAQPTDHDPPATPPGRERIVLAGGEAYAPLAFRDQDGRMRGLLVDIWALWSERTGVEVEYLLLPWQEALDAVRQGRADALLGFSAGPERAREFGLSRPFYKIESHVYFTQGLLIDGLEDLAGFEVGVVRGDYAQEYVSQRLPGARIRQFDSYESMVRAGLSGRVEVFVGDCPVVRFYLAKLAHGDGGLQQSPEPLYVQDVVSGVTLGDSALLALVNQGFERIAPEEVAEITERWRGLPAGSGHAWRIVALVSGGAIALFLLILAWNGQLRRRVNEAVLESEGRTRAMEAAEARTQAILRSMTSLVVVADLRGNIRRVVPTGYEFKRYPPAEMEGMHFTEMVGVEESETVLKTLRRVALGERSASCQFRMELDIRRWFTMSVTPMQGEKVLAVIRDITALKKSEQKYRELVQLANCIILRLDPEGRVVFFNEFAERFFGYSRLEILGRSLLGTILPERDSQGHDLKAQVAEVLADPGNHPHWENENLRKDGTRVWVEWNNRPMFEEGRLSGILCVGSDVTHRKVAQMEMANREHYFRSLIEHSSDLITVIDENGMIFFEAPSVQACLGARPDDMVGLSLAEQVHEDDLNMVLGLLKRLAGGGDAQLFEFRRRTVQGDYRYMEAMATNLLHDPVVGGIVINSRNVTERKGFEEELRQHIFYDSLTGLPNRVLFLEHVKQAMEKVRRRDDYSFAVLFMNLDRFKLVNEGLGHSTGDELLCEVSARLKECMRKVDTVARMGGDEFVLLLEEVDDDRIPIRAAERIQTALSRPMFIRGVEVSTTASIGIVFSNPDYSDPEQLIRDGDAAMHRAKAKGTGGFRVFHSRMHRQALGLLRLEQDLRKALERQEFEVHYQPIVDLENMTIAGVEALVRWNHPDQGMVLPGAFIPLAEETGLIIPLGEWVLRRACQEIGSLCRSLGSAEELVLTVNLSAKQFTYPELAANTRSILESTGFEARRLKLEVTETVLMENPDEAAAVLEDLRRTGLSLAIDDFGTGYSSLGTLHRFPFDTLKIDRSFVSQLTRNNGTDTRKIIQTIMGLASGLGMRAIAEGIENEVQRQAMVSLGCRLGQGFYFSRPVSAGDMGRLLAAEGEPACSAVELVAGQQGA